MARNLEDSCALGVPGADILPHEPRKSVRDRAANACRSGRGWPMGRVGAANRAAASAIAPPMERPRQAVHVEFMTS